MNKKRFFTCMAVASACTLTLACTACAPNGSSETSSNDGAAITDYSDDSILAAHEARGSDIADITEVSIENCTSSGCHGGSWEELAEKNEGMWPGIGQISDANPHASHASNAYECSDCHSLAGTSVNQCNGCHDFESPEGWTDKDKTTATDGPTNNEPVY